MKYNVGDKVRVRKDLRAGDGKLYLMDGKSFGDTFVDNMAHLVGKVVTIKTANKMYTIEECGYNWTDEMFEPVNEHKIVITTDGTETLARLYDGNKVIKSATAKCSPDDAFDFATGAKIAFERLIGEEKKEKPSTASSKYKAGGKVRVIANSCCHYCRLGDVVTLTENFKVDERGVCWNVKENVGYIRECDFEPYKEPKYYNGKVVCVKSDRDFTVGKVYEFIDGQVKDNDETMRPVGAKIKKLEDYNGHLYEFIPFVE